MHENPEKMGDFIPMEEEIQHLRIQNSQFAEMFQRQKMIINKLEREKLGIIKENTLLTMERNRYRAFALKMKDIEKAVEDNATQSLRDIVKVSDHLRKVVELVKGQYKHDIDIDKNTSSPKSGSVLNNSSNNIHHVSPMIKGITLKNPIIRVSRAILAPSQRSAARRLSGEAGFENPSEPVEENEIQQSVPSIPMLGVYVSLVDNITQRRTNPDQERGDGASHSSPLEHPSNALDDQSSFGQLPMFERESTESALNDEDMFNEDEMFMSGNGEDYENRTFPYIPRLDCVMEETENDSAKWSPKSPSKLNPFVVLNRHLDDLKTLQSPQNNFPIADNDDPLEGPSWRLDGSYVNFKRNNNEFVSMRKKKKMFLDSSLDVDSNIVENDQQPDSTTTASTQENSMKQTDISSISAPHDMFTPNVSDNAQESSPVSVLKINSPKKSSSKASDTVKRNTKSLSDAKVSSKVKKTNTTKVEAKRNNKLKSNKSLVNEVVEEAQATENETSMRSSGCDTSNVRGSTLDISNNDDSQSDRSNRPRRGAHKNYKEKSLSEKMRRN